MASSAKTTGPTKTGSAKATDIGRDVVDPTRNYLTSDQGVKISDTDHWLKISDGTHVGPQLLEDQLAREKLTHFDHERIPERVVHARGTGAYGYFKVHDDRAAAKYTYAPVLTDPSRKTPVFVRFSTVQGSRGSADTVRDVRGFATKFYTEEGNWDLVGNDIPVFFIQDSVKFPDFVHAVKPEPHNEVPQGQSAHNNFWDFVGLQPESAHMVMWVMSDRGIPRSFRMMQGFGVNTYTLHKLGGEQFFVKFHWIPELGVHSLVWDEALKISGQDPDFHRKDLYEAIENGAFPKWKFCIQVIPSSKEHDFDFDILDATKLWPEELKSKQVAFCTANVVPGIGFSDDPLLQGRNFSYFDTSKLPVNRPVCPVLNHQRDGQMRHRITAGNINYWPNRKEVFRPVLPQMGGYYTYPSKVQGIRERARGQKFQEHWNHAQLNILSTAISFELDHCDDPVVYETYTKVLNCIDFELAKKVASNIGSTIPDKPGRENHGKSSKPLSQLYYFPKDPTVVERRIAILVADGFNFDEVQAMRNALSSAKARTFIIGPHRGEIRSSEGAKKCIKADHHFEGQHSTLFDALYIPFWKPYPVIQYVRESFGHCKAIAASGLAIGFLRDTVDLPGVEFQHEDSADVKTSYGVVTTGKLDVKSAMTGTLRIKQDSKDFMAEFGYVISRHRCYDREMDGLTSRVAY
ncbi:catalase [Russula earlei]|uniref:Catalase n=1 Tax=Russula earlei TaxID=71964 RepID=A0ACC0UME2_9AGAM|nr:catalase [Russula earlei]